ncbi:ABC transporter permease [Profundibacterium mesophilum]|uniref:Oligopeptide transport integral membrane protein n=1 Tax=Profundibacterium mesophilum KAUST100406-0324 TaxID=1037889 RepID=A0A921NX87_9RHOB|nr:ABC transporter permease [Profundibacterium mesophilum]KAF0675203.1 Oligopeptide transport integral membrane protein [Profundibacterium mesophilum KAUST100406-0324]
MEQLGAAQIIVALGIRLWPVFAAMGALGALSFVFRARLGLYGRLYSSAAGIAGLALVSFWVLTGIFGAADLLITHDPLSPLSGMKNAPPGSALRMAEDGQYPHVLLGGDNLARDVFSRVVMGAWEVVKIAPAATLFAFMIGITLGLPAAYFGGWLDTVLTFAANLILAFPVILLFYLLVTPEIVASGVPGRMAAVLFVLPLIFAIVLVNSRTHVRPVRRAVLLGVTILVGGWLYLGIALDADPLGLISFPPSMLVVFVAVVFVNAPTVFRIVRGLGLDIRERDYIAAARTRSEGPWYVMLWEILPNVRGPLIVDFCLRIGYTTILLGTLGFFGLGLSPESPDWGSTINEGRKLLSIYPHPALAPAISLLSLVLGLNLLADGVREESLRD